MIMMIEAQEIVSHDYGHFNRGAEMRLVVNLRASSMKLRQGNIRYDCYNRYGWFCMRGCGELTDAEQRDVEIVRATDLDAFLAPYHARVEEYWNAHTIERDIMFSEWSMDSDWPQ
jgi:hypothetical protein